MHDFVAQHTLCPMSQPALLPRLPSESRKFRVPFELLQQNSYWNALHRIVNNLVVTLDQLIRKSPSTLQLSVRDVQPHLANTDLGSESRSGQSR